MKPYQTETTLGIAASVVILLVAVLFTDIVSNFNYKEVKQSLNSDAMKLTASIVKDKKENNEITIIPNGEANGEIILGTAEEIAAKQQAKLQASIAKAEAEKAAMIVYDGLTISELTAKLNKVLKSTLAGQGEVYATKSIELGIDPYLAVAITLLETGCNNGTCSTLVNQCNNVGGIKGYPSCNGGSYERFPSLQEGIVAYLENIYYNYYAVGLTTPETMNRKYASSNLWATKVNKYIEKIRAA